MKRYEFEKLEVSEQRVGFMLTANERKEICKELKLQQKGKIPQPINNLTLAQYFDIVKEGFLALCDDNGYFSRPWSSSEERINIKDMPAIEVARKFMDGRSLFHSRYGDKNVLLVEIDHNNTEQFKHWAITPGYGGHPWETTFGNIYPHPLLKEDATDYTLFERTDENYSNKWILYIPAYHRADIWAFRVFLRLRKLGYPVVWEMGKWNKKHLSKRYFVDLSDEPKWFRISYNYFDKS